MIMQFTSQTYDDNFYALDTALHNLDWMIFLKNIWLQIHTYI